MPKITMEKLSELLTRPVALSGAGSHHFLKLDPEEAFTALYLQTKDKAGDIPTIYYDGSHSTLSSEPFFPLFTELKTQLSQPDLKGVYTLHKDLWSHFFSGEDPNRGESFLYSEKEYEQDRIREDFIKLWSQRPAQPRIVFVDKVHKLSPTLWHSLTIGMTTPKNQIWIWHIPKNFQPEDPRSKALWENFLLSIDNRLLEYNLSDVRVEIRSTEVRNRPAYKTLLKNMEMSFAFLDTYQARALAKEAIQTTLTNPQLIQDNPLHYLRLLEVQGDTELLSEDYEKSLLTYTQALTFCQENNLKAQSCVILAKSSLVHDRRNNYATAEKGMILAWKQAQVLGDPALEAEILFFFYYLSLDENFVREHYTQFLNLQKYLATQGLKNHQAALQTLTSFISVTLEKESSAQAVKYCDEGIALAEGLKNKFALSVGYHCRGFIAQNEQNYSLALDYYQKSEKIRRLLGNKTELIKICNGTGFFCLLTQQFEPALTYFNKALKLLLEHRDFRELGMTLFNMGMVYFFSFQQDKALVYFQNLLSMMNILEMENLPFQSRRQIHSLIGLCQFKLGQHQGAWQSFYKAEQNPAVADPVHSFFFVLLKALLTTSTEDWNEAYRFTQMKNYSILAYYFAVEWGIFNRDIIKSGRQVQIWEDALGEISLYEGPFYSRRFQELLEGKRYSDLAWKVKEPNINELLEIAHQEKTTLRLRKKMGEMNFLTSLINHLEAVKDVDSLLKGVLTLIRQSFIVESGFIVLKDEKGQFSCAGQFAINPQMDTLKLHNLLFTHSSPQYFHRISNIEALKDFHEQLESLVFLPLVHNERYLGGMILGSTSRTLGFSEEELAPLSIAAAQTASEVDFITHQEKLQASDPKDELTGLVSKQELRRMPLKDKTGVLYIHLDNFRAYNDRYGRAVGDLVLQKFAGLLHIASRQEDLVVRYGGVEFVILVPDTGTEGAKKVAQRILKEMKNRKNFQDALETFLGRPLELTEQDQLACSIGISEMQGTQSLEEALAKVKSEGKGNYFVV